MIAYRPLYTRGIFLPPEVIRKMTTPRKYIALSLSSVRRELLLGPKYLSLPVEQDTTVLLSFPPIFSHPKKKMKIVKENGGGNPGNIFRFSTHTSSLSDSSLSERDIFF